MKTFNNRSYNFIMRIRQDWHSPVYQLKIVFLLLMILIVLGVSFYNVVLHWSLPEALLQIVLTVSTLGGDAHPGAVNNPVYVWFSIFYIIAILLVVLWGISLLIEATVSGALVYYWGTLRMEKRIDQLSGHYILCGYGRMGHEIAAQFTRAKQTFVVVEHNPVQIRNLEATQILFINGDAREDDILLRAGIRRAKGVVAVAATDEENVYITLSARVLNPDLHIVTRSSNPSGEAKLERAGANQVFSPYIIGGRRMAQAILRPSVVDFIDTIIHGEQMELVLEEITVQEGAEFCGMTIGGKSRQSDVEHLGVHLLGITTLDGETLLRNLQEHELQEGDTLILLGSPDAVRQATEHLISGKSCNLPK